MLLMRSLLFVPANRDRFIESAHRCAADVVCLDLEDSVPPAEKEAARSRLATAAASLRAAGKTVHVRVNHTETGLTRDDLAAAVSPDVAGLNFPKAQGAQDIRDLDVLIREQELKKGVKPGTTGVIASVETALGVLRCEEIATASTRLIGICVGAYDYVADLGIERRRDGRDVEYARRVIVHCCVAYGLQPLDTVWGEIQDEAGLIDDAAYGRSIGFKGKYIIHPAHAQTVNRIYSPAPEEVAWARRVVAAFDEAVAQGHASVQLDGRMIDIPVAKRARDLVAYAEAIAGRSPA